MFGFGLKDFIKSELAKLQGDISDNIKRTVKTSIEDGMAAKGVKGAAYQYLDGMLAEGQSMSKERLDAWWVEKRAQLKTWAGQ
jgi:hypothetical protein